MMKSWIMESESGEYKWVSYRKYDGKIQGEGVRKVEIEIWRDQCQHQHVSTFKCTHGASGGLSGFYQPGEQSIVIIQEATLDRIVKSQN